MSRLTQKLKIWIDARFPMSAGFERHLSKYYVPKNLNLWYIFGLCAMLMLVNQLLSGIMLTMHYSPTPEGAFDSVQHIMRDVDMGWLMRYLHSTGASMLFVVLYLHMFRSLLYGSYQRPRELVWLIGMAMYVLFVLEGFCGYILPWGNLSYWGAQVVFSLPSSIPVIGEPLANWLRGDYGVTGVTLTRCYALHIIAIPLLIGLLLWKHIVALHHVGSNNPDGIEIRDQLDAEGIPLDGIPLHPYFTLHHLYGIVVFLMVFFAVVFFYPTGGGYLLEPANSIPANPLQTPVEITPAWYYTPLYAMLRAIPSKLGGVLALAAAIAVLFVLPWLDRSPVKSMRYKGIWSRLWLLILLLSVIVLGLIGLTPLDHALLPFMTNQHLAQLFTLLYFLYFILMPFYTRYETCTQPPTRVTR
jgi:ubiquinol-cytochrome c reductase cytochrome b subunit